MTPHVIDVSKYEPTADWLAVRRGGVRGVIAKATEGRTYVDSTYSIKRIGALEAGLLWGAYHFLRPGDMALQAEHFLSFAKTKAGDLIAIDHEDLRVGLPDLKAFARIVREKSGHSALLYSGHVLKEQLGGKPDWELVELCPRLWLAQYSSHVSCPPGWKVPWLHQFTGDGAGPGPHSVPGIKQDGIDVDTAPGGIAQLEAEWSGALPEEKGSFS